MTSPSDSPIVETRKMNMSLSGPKAQIHIGAWNVRTMYETSKTAQVIKEMCCYAQTNNAKDDTKDDFNEQLQTAISKVPQHDMLVIMGDLNANVGSDNTDSENVMGRHGCGVKNKNGERAIDLCLCNKLVIGWAIFPHKNIHKLTWKSPDGISVNQIDHILVNNKWRRSLRDVRVLRGADVNSDHYLLKATNQIKIKKGSY
ncbi:craniofacial development protein 2-like [Mytilus edulis]|uniref:craniofacial development protein 2-like n=1 Tax=Mytilus edulis TaxID=6550 RepID=UPI0039EF96C7